MAGMTEHPESWADVDLENALPSDPRPWAALRSALAERCAAVHRPLPAGVQGVYLPSVAACEAVRAEIQYLCRECFVTLAAPREDGIGWNFQIDRWGSYPRTVWPDPFYRPDDVDYVFSPPFPESGHPMHEPPLLAPEGDGGEAVYRAFLADCAFWLDQCRYVDASGLAVCEETRGSGSWEDTLAASLAGITPEQDPERGIVTVEARYSHNGTTAKWRVQSGPYKLYAVNPSPLPAKALLVLTYHGGPLPESSSRSYEKRDTERNTPGQTFQTVGGSVYAKSSTNEKRTEYRHGDTWVAEMVETYSASGVEPELNGQGEIVGADYSNATATRTHTVRVWNEAGDRSWLNSDRSWTRSYSQHSASTNADDEASAEYSLFDPFGYGDGAGVSDTYVTVPAFERALLVDLATAFTPALNPSSLLPTADEVSLYVRLSCTPCVVLDYHDAYKFKLGEES